MYLYHGSNVVVSKPKILTPTINLELGKGFYTTPNKSIVVKFAIATIFRYQSVDRKITNIYVIDLEKVKRKLKILEFGIIDEAWLNYVSNNLVSEDIFTEYDLIIGPVAIGEIFDLVTDYAKGVLTAKEVLLELRTKKTYYQVTFKSKRSLHYLKYIGFEEEKNG